MWKLRDEGDAETEIRTSFSGIHGFQITSDSAGLFGYPRVDTGHYRKRAQIRCESIESRGVTLGNSLLTKYETVFLFVDYSVFSKSVIFLSNIQIYYYKN